MWNKRNTYMIYKRIAMFQTNTYTFKLKLGLDGNKDVNKQMVVKTAWMRTLCAWSGDQYVRPDVHIGLPLNTF